MNETNVRQRRRVVEREGERPCNKSNARKKEEEKKKKIAADDNVRP